MFNHSKLIILKMIKFSLKNLSNHLKPKNNYKKVKISLYYRPKKLQVPTILRRAIVYYFKCNQDSCNATYIGYTMCKLITRAKQHRYNNSKIYDHFKVDHNSCPDISIEENFSILYNNNKFRNVKIAESILIKNNRPYINVKYNEMENSLHIF